MSDVNADPDKLRQFARVLTKSADQLQQVTRTLTRALDSTGWNDRERQKFEQDFKQTMRTLEKISETLRNQYAPAVQKKAAALDQYRGR